MTEDLDEKERALVVLGRAIVKKPKVFLLDEPFSSLSKELKKEMQELLWSLYEKMQITVVYVTHNSEDIRHTDTRVAVMNDGRSMLINHRRFLHRHRVFVAFIHECT